MADSLVLTGVKDIKKHTGTEMLLTRPKHGGDTHHLKEWWKGNGKNKCYIDCTVFNVTVGSDTVKLVLDTSMSTNVRIDHDGAFNFTFIGSNEIRRAALFTDAYELIEHYVFPAISGGKIMTVTPPGAASRPGGGGSGTTIGTVTVNGTTSPNTGTNVSYTADISGTASNLAYSWSVSGTGTITSPANNPGVTVEFTAGAATVTCQISDPAASDSPQSGNLNVTAS